MPRTEAVPTLTLTTIGYGAFAPTGRWMRLYTAVYAVMGIGLFVAFSARLAQIAIDLQRRRAGEPGGDDEAS